MVLEHYVVFKNTMCPDLLHACPYTISEWDRYRVDISPHCDMNGTLQSQKYKSQHSFISILQSSAWKETVKTIKDEFEFQNYTLYGKYNTSRKDNCSIKIMMAYF